MAWKHKQARRTVFVKHGVEEQIKAELLLNPS